MGVGVVGVVAMPVARVGGGGPSLRPMCGTVGSSMRLPLLLLPPAVLVCVHIVTPHPCTAVRLALPLPLPQRGQGT